MGDGMGYGYSLLNTLVWLATKYTSNSCSTQTLNPVEISC